LLQRRPDVQAAEAKLRAAASARDLARAGRMPDVTVGAQAEHYPISESNTTGSGNSFGVFISIPLFVRHSNGGEARRAEVDYYAALDDRNRVLLAAQNEIERSQSQLESSRQAYAQMRDAVLPAAESVANSAEFAYTKGASGVLDLLDARRALRQTRLDAATAQGEYAKAVSAYLAALRSSTTSSNTSATNAGGNSSTSLPQVRPDAPRQ
jgi:cobalt-zinc-cadmium efflux system outer membrane protein